MHVPGLWKESRHVARLTRPLRFAWARVCHNSPQIRRRRTLLPAMALVPRESLSDLQAS